MFLQNVMLLAREYDLHTCPQAAWLNQHRVVRSTLGIGTDLTLACGMALSYADKDAAVNAYQPPREPHTALTIWHDPAGDTALPADAANGD